MRALHLFSNWKWTGPAELAVNICRGLRGLGVDVRFACGREPSGPDGAASVRARARERGIEALLPGLRLGKHVRIFANRADAQAVRRAVASDAIDIV
ncbi:MAG: hypothetical protein ACRELB_21295, partial [Polyangiaceae bacterium]